MDLNEGIKKTAELIKNKKVAVLYGTGLSYNFGVFDANGFYTNILSSLKLDEKEDAFFDEKSVEMVINRASQFEDFLMRLYDDLNINENYKDDIFRNLLNIYNVGKSNINHYFLAYLMQKKYVKVIYTTNFDQLLEKTGSAVFNGKEKRVFYILEGSIISLENDRNSSKIIKKEISTEDFKKNRNKVFETTWLHKRV